MASFDIVSKVEIQRLDNAINTAKKEIMHRYDFYGSKSAIELDKKTLNIFILTENNMRMKALQDVIIAHMVKQGLNPASLDMGTDQYASGNMVKKEVKIKQGIDKETARKIVRVVKESGMKLQGTVMDDQVRVTGKKLDDLQKMIQMIRITGFEIPLQFENFRS